MSDTTADNTSMISRVRRYVQDDGVGNTLSGGDRDFSDEDIADAIRDVVGLYNEIPPITSFGDTQIIDLRLNFWLAGIAQGLYEGLLQRLIRKNLTFQAGDVTVSPYQQQIVQIEKLITKFGEAFTKGAANHKQQRNLYSYFGRVG